MFLLKFITIIILISILSVLNINFSKLIFKNKFNPLSLFLTIWSSLIVVYITIFNEINLKSFIIIIASIISFVSGCIVVTGVYKLKIKNNKEKKIIFTDIDELIFRKIIWISILCRVGQAFFAINRIIKSVGSLSLLIENPTYIRYILNSRPDIPTSIIERILPNLLNYGVMIGIVVSGIYIFLDKRKFILPLFLVTTGPLIGLITGSKQGTIVELLVFINTVFIFYTISKKNIVKRFDLFPLENIRLKKISIFKVTCIVILIFLALIIGIGIQRGYREQISPIPGIPTTFAKLIMYIILPIIGFNELVVTSSGMESLGARTFRPIVKWLISFNILKSEVLPPFFDSFLESGAYSVNVFTWLGLFYKDWGVVGAIITPFYMALIISFTFIKAISRPNLFWIGYSSINLTILCMSFYNYLAQETFYILFPFTLIPISYYCKKSLNKRIKQ